MEEIEESDLSLWPIKEDTKDNDQKVNVTDSLVRNSFAHKKMVLFYLHLSQWNILVFFCSPLRVVDTKDCIERIK